MRQAAAGPPTPTQCWDWSWSQSQSCRLPPASSPWLCMLLLPLSSQSPPPHCFSLSLQPLLHYPYLCSTLAGSIPPTTIATGPGWNSTAGSMLLLQGWAGAMVCSWAAAGMEPVGVGCGAKLSGGGRARSGRETSVRRGGEEGEQGPEAAGDRNGMEREGGENMGKENQGKLRLWGTGTRGYKWGGRQQGAGCLSHCLLPAFTQPAPYHLPP